MSTYVERSYPEGRKPDADEISAHGRNVIRELQDWGWVRDVDVMDPTRMEVADTSSWAGSQWRQKAPAALETHDIYPIGQYARWVFQGIADFIRDGLIAGAPMTASHRRSAEEAHPRQERSQGAV